MQDAAAFFRHRARAAFYRRRKYPVNSEDWRQSVDEARRFIRYHREAATQQSDPEYLKERLASDERIAESLRREIEARNKERQPPSPAVS
jgi:phage terminase Nu1 subunit (DNA packaging protein)